MPGVGKAFRMKEPRFAEDDLNLLVELGLLRQDFTSRGNKQFYITRNAVEFINQIESNASKESCRSE